MGGMETGLFLLGYRLGYNKTKMIASIKHLIYWIANKCWVLWGCRLGECTQQTLSTHGRHENKRPPKE